MRKYICFLLLLFFVSCERDIVVSGDDYTPETAQLRNLYLEKIYGEWMYTETSTFSHIEQYYNLCSDGTIDGHVLFMTRDSVFINGEKVITDWKRIIDNDITGEWSLLYKASLKKNVLYFNAKGKIGKSQYVDFVDVNDSILEIQSPLIISKIIKMHRKEIGSSDSKHSN